MIAAALAFLAGATLVQGFAVLPALLPWLAGCLIAAAALRALGDSRLLWLPLGVAWTLTVAHGRMADRLPESLAGVELAVAGRIDGLPEQDDREARFDFIVTQAMAPLPSRLRLTWRDPGQTVGAGQHWAFTVRLKPPHGSLNPGGFDYERWLFSAGVGATGHVRGHPPPRPHRQASAWADVDVLRQAIARRLDAFGLPHGGLIKALAIGDGGGLSPAQWQLFRQTGTLHLVVISGSHIALVAGLVYWLALRGWLRTGCLRWPPPVVAAWAAIGAGVGYAALAGFTVPCQRALVMLLVFMAAIIRQRPRRPYNTLAVALLAVLAYDPLAVLAPGFWLSFAAVAAIIHTVAGRLGKAPYWVELTAGNTWIALALAPLLLWFFQQLPLVSPLANMVAVPAIGLLMVPLALLATVLAFVWQALAAPLLWALDGALAALLAVLEAMAAWPTATLVRPQPPPWALLLALPGVVWLLAPAAVPGRWLGLVMLLPLWGEAPQPPAAGEMRLTVLDVGQGLAVAVQTANHWFLYDTGPKFYASDSGLNVLLPFFASQGARHLDGLMLSHADTDHAGGARSLVRGLPVAKILAGTPGQLAEFNPTPCQAGQSWTWDGVEFAVLSPGAQPFANDNDNSCVLKITAATGSALLTGDIQKAAERRLVASHGEALRADVLLAPHHGSNSSSSLPFLRHVRPTWALVSAGYRNRFRHPHPKVQARYLRQQIIAVNTAQAGAVTVHFATGGPKVSGFRDTDGKYWNWRPPEPGS